MPTCTGIQIQYLKAEEKLLILPPTALSFIKGKEGYKMIWNPRRRFVLIRVDVHRIVATSSVVFFLFGSIVS